jgi:hypothetical protein
VGEAKAAGRKRAVGTRDSVLSYLAGVGEINDASGMASTALAEAIGYPGSSVAFAQLLSGMERSGLIEREIRGKRTYRIAAAEDGPAKGASAETAVAGRGGARRPGSRSRAATTRGAATGAAAIRAAATRGTATGAAAARAAATQAAPTRAAGPKPAMATRQGSEHVGADDGSAQGLAGAGAAGGDVDYDELARRLLVQVVQRLAVSPSDDPALSGAGRAEPAGAGPEDAALQKTVASLEQKLASVQSKQRRLTAENAKLREQLQAAQQSLARAQERDRADQGARRFDSAEVLLLERLLSPLRDKGDRREEAGAG